MKKNVLFISYGFPPFVGATSERALMFVRGLAQRGWQITVYCAKENQPIQRIRNRNSMQLVPDSVRIRRIEFPKIRASMEKTWPTKAVTRLLCDIPDPYVLWSRECLKTLEPDIQDLKPDAIFTTSPPHSIQMTGMRLAVRFRVPWIMDLRDAWMHNRRQRWFSPIHKRLSNYWYKRAMNSASVIIANTRPYADVLAKTHPTCRERIVCIPNGYSSELWDKAKPVHLQKRNPTDFVILYSGNDYPVRGSVFSHIQQANSPGSISGVLKTLGRHLAARQLQDNGPNFSVVMLGPEKNQGKRTAFDPLRLGTVNFSEVPGYLLAADLLVLCMPRQEAGSALIPLKSYGYARSGKPVLYLGPKNVTYDYLEKRTTIKQFDLNDLENAAQWIAENSSNLTGNHHRASAELWAEDSFERRVDDLERVLNKIC